MTATAAPPGTLGVALISAGGEPLTQLVAPALRRNPRRAHLLVSTVLGKHVPVDPRLVGAAGRRLGQRVAERLAEPPALVIGYAETATALGHCVAETLRADYVHSTRRAVPGVRPVLAFTEPHSHAADHLVSPARPALLWEPGVVVLVDDELSTGTTALNTIAELQRLVPRPRYVVGALVDVRPPADRARMRARADELHTAIDVVALGSGSAAVPNGLPEAVAATRAATAADVAADHPAGARGRVIAVPRVWPAGVPEGARHGVTAAETVAMREAAAVQAALLDVAGPDVLVLGSEELMYAPLLIAEALAHARPDVRVRLSSTTRSPAVVLDAPGYPLRTQIRFRSPESPGEWRFAYNVGPGTSHDTVLVLDECAAAGDLDDLLTRLQAVAQRVHVVVLPQRRPTTPPALRGPAFGSYAAEDVAWLLTDLSREPLEAPVAQRERAIRAGRAHYAESLPVEYQPSEEYRALFAAALAASARRVAHAVGTVTELLLAERSPAPVLVSLARAGTPIGILMRRWAQSVHNLDLPHYAVSIVRGRGIDPVALRALAAAHDPSDVVFVDGWTGKGAIARELATAIAQTDPRFSAELAVLADTGHCVSLFGTREDFLIPSACLNSTVSGLVSRTVLNDRLVGPGDFHGAKFYAELRSEDVSATFLDAVTGCFRDVQPEVAASWPALRASDRRPTWAGWAEVQRIAAQFTVGDLNLVKPGVGETTRVLLRRVPWRVLVRPGAEADLAHVLLLADQRGVPVVPVRGLAYSCVGLIDPTVAAGHGEQ